MAIPSKQIGWGTEENLLWQISKQLENLTKVAGNIGKTTSSTTTSTTTINPNNISLTVANNSGLFDIPESTDFTIEWFMYLAADDNHPRGFSFGSYFTGGAAHALSIENGTIYWWVNGTPYIASSQYNVVGGWHHICIQRTVQIIAGSPIYVAQVYVDGNSLSSSTGFTQAIPTNGLPLYIGSEGDDSLANGLFSNFRWNNSQAIYDPNGFTPPTAPLSTNSGTTLLLFQGNNLGDELVDYSGYMNVINNGTGIYNSGNPFAGQEGSVQFGTL